MTHLFPVALVWALLAAPPKDPQVEAQLHALFNKWDLNQDGFLDRDELAKHFRGRAATSPKGDLYDDKGRLSPLYYEARKKYPDLIFLWTLDTDLDGKVSWQEFEIYGQDYAAVLKQRLQSRQQLVLAQQRALQNVYRQMNRNVRNVQRRRSGYVRNANRAYGLQRRHAAQQYRRNLENYQRQVKMVQGAMMRQYRYALERQQNFYRMAMQQRQRWLQQYQSYLRQRMAFANRMPMRHFYPTYRRMWR